MTTFNYTSGDPTNLTGGATANMGDISGPFADVKTFVNGNVDATNLATSAKPVTLLGQYRTVAQAGLDFASGSGGATYIPPLSTGTPIQSGVASTPPFLVGIDPADHSVTGLTTRYRLKLMTATSAVANGVTLLTASLYPVTFAGSANLFTTTLGSSVSGSAVSRANPALSSGYLDAGSDFAPPSSGLYTFGVLVTGTVATNARISVQVLLQVHHV